MDSDTARRWPLPLRIALPVLGALAVATPARIIGGPVAAMIGGVVIAGLALLTLRVLDRRDYREAGLVRPGLAWRHLLLGFLAWLVPSGAVIIVLVVAGQVGLRVPDGAAWLGPVAVQLAVIMVGQVLPYELIFRGSVLSNLAERYGGWGLIIRQGLLYGAFLTCLRLATGVPSVITLLLDATFAVCVGIALGYARAVSGSVWVSAGLHLAYLIVTALIGDPTLGLVDRPLDWWPALFAYGVVPFGVGLACVETLVRQRPQLISRV
ncbi:CPBP family intramembrane glutamic endopeptidase [Microlunatus parietis]|uniref:Membrane protease YdiL (CAAX protease family) n=1 Tax=Microlunatus parietis TaxID=682979 RepID=A0A7Y9IBL3_9ACTN|nr:CPBP family intramembrane glutamic endopeptidase [Microlunatus parietis]NYE73916.1 membrane protease YdiL (CAAX protease family) [Microlunatus parietis]